MTTRILIVDDDSTAIQQYRDTLASKTGEWHIDYAADGDAGIAAAEIATPDIVIAALSTAERSKDDLLARLEEIAPDAQRFLTAKETDKPKLESTFGSSFHYLPSPCPAQRLITEIQRCVAIDQWLGNDRIKEVVAKMGAFPSLPPIYLKVVNALNSRHIDTETIAASISGDLAISAKLLQTVNSSFYGFDEKVGDVSEAINILGTDCVKNLVLAIQVFNSMGHSPEHKAVTDELWHHSMSVAVAARRIAAYEGKDEKAAEQAYTAGLMHDIGKLILLNAVPDAHAQARELAQETSVSLKEAEDQAIGCNHAETGAYVLARWGMPTDLIEAVALHHEPIDSFGKSFSTLAAVHIANAIVHHRKNPEHPSAATSDAFLLEVGKSDSWQDWLDVTSGKKPQGGKAGLTLNRPAENAPTADHPAEPTDANSAQATPDSRPEKKSSKAPAIALAACAALAAVGIYALNTIGSSDPLEAANVDGPSFEALPHLENVEAPAEQPADLAADAPAAEQTEAVPETSGLASKIEAARQLSGLARTEDALEEIFDSQTPEAADTEAPPAAVAQVAAAPKPQSANRLPKPQLPSVQDTFPNIQLAGIFYNADRPLASVNGKIRRVGDTVSGAQIVRIDPHQVVVKYEDTLRAFKLN